MARAQASTESMVMLAVGLGAMLILLAILLGVGTTTSSTYDRGMGRAFTDDLGDTMEQVWRQGEGARQRVYVQFPENAGALIANRTSIVLLRADGQPTYVRTFTFNVTGDLNATTGGHWARVERTGGLITLRTI